MMILSDQSTGTEFLLQFTFFHWLNIHFHLLNLKTSKTGAIFFIVVSYMKLVFSTLSFREGLGEVWISYIHL